MRVLFVVDHFSVVEPLGVLQLSAILKARGHETSVCALDDGKGLDAIAACRPDAVACSLMTTQAARVGAFVAAARRRFPRLVIIAGGPHPTYYPQIVDRWPLDALVVGEGDLVIGPLLEGLCGGRSVRSLPNVHTKEFKNPQGDLVADLDELPFPDRELVAGEFPFRSIRMKSFFASRGCPYNCSYCYNSAFNAMHRGKGKILRRRSVENLVREIEAVKGRYRLDFVRFGDDNFVTAGDAWLEEFVESYRTRIGIPFYCLINPNLVDERLVGALRSAGCHSVMMGIESGNEAIRRQVLSRTMTDATLRRAFSLFREHGILVFSNTILGLPDTGLEQDLESLEFTLDCRPYYSGFTVFTPFPGTKLGDYVREKGYLQSEDPLSEACLYGMQSGSVLSTVTPRQREIHRNILVLAPVANLFPRLRRLVTRRLIYRKPNALFHLLGFGVRNYCNWRIFPFRTGILTFVRLVWKVSRIDRESYRDYAQGSGPAPDHAGGPAPVAGEHAREKRVESVP